MVIGAPGRSLFLFITLASIVLSLLTLILRSSSLIHGAYGETICFFALSWYLCKNSRIQKKSLLGVTFSIIAGRLLTEAVLRVIGCYNLNIYSIVPISSALIPFITCVSVILAMICCYERRIITYVLSTIILLLINSALHHSWLEYCLAIRNNMP